MQPDAARLAILGSYPPPYGGVSMHVMRLCPLLERRGIRVVAYNATSDVGDGRIIIPVYRHRGRWLLRYLFTAREPVIYILSDRLIVWLIGAMMASWRGKRVLLRLRNAALPDWIAQSRWRRWLAGVALRRMTAVVCVSRRLADAAATLGVEPRRIHQSAGFLPPTAEEVDAANLPQAFKEFAQCHEPLIVANGKVDWYQGQDLYGFDQLVSLAARLKPDYPNVGIAVSFWNHCEEDAAYLNRLIQRAEQEGVRDNLLFNTEGGFFVPVIARADLFVRPTRTDGDANSIREALHLKVPAVASDAVERPAGTILFRTGDVDDFEARVRSALSRERTSGAQECRPLSDEDSTRVDNYLSLLAAVADDRYEAPLHGAGDS